MQQVHVSATYSAYGRSSREGNSRTNDLSQNGKEQPQLGFQQRRIQLAQHSEGSYEQTWTGINATSTTPCTFLLANWRLASTSGTG